MNEFENFFWNKNKKSKIHKWHHYFEIYEKFLSCFKYKHPVILEIGLWKGGSCEMWNDYFQGECHIHGVDNKPTCLEIPAKLGVSNIKVDIGDQGSVDFWNRFFVKYPDLKFDFIVDDGGHTMEQQIQTFKSTFPRLKNGGVYFCEDVHTSYMKEYGGGDDCMDTFLNYSRKYVDKINSFHNNINFDAEILDNVKSLHFYDSVVVFEKTDRIIIPENSVR